MRERSKAPSVLMYTDWQMLLLHVPLTLLMQRLG